MREPTFPLPSHIETMSMRKLVAYFGFIFASAPGLVW
jgi:hypothetical protein